jgi:hypothetical protein
MDQLNITHHGDLLVITGLTSSASRYLRAKYPGVQETGKPYYVTLVRGITKKDLTTNKTFVNSQKTVKRSLRSSSDEPSTSSDEPSDSSYESSEDEPIKIVKKRSYPDETPETLHLKISRNLSRNSGVLYNANSKFNSGVYESLISEFPQSAKIDYYYDKVKVKIRGRSVDITYPKFMKEIIEDNQGYFTNVDVDTVSDGNEDYYETGSSTDESSSSFSEEEYDQTLVTIKVPLRKELIKDKEEFEKAKEQFFDDIDVETPKKMGMSLKEASKYTSKVKITQKGSYLVIEYPKFLEKTLEKSLGYLSI